jgi:5-methylcytosine-specific restriction endonuclease McrA
MWENISEMVLVFLEKVRPGSIDRKPSHPSRQVPGYSDAEHEYWTRVVNRHLRIASRQTAAGVASASQVDAVIRFYGGRCWLCGDPGNSIDHAIPLRSGGTNWPANLRPICFSCNHRRRREKMVRPRASTV